MTCTCQICGREVKLVKGQPKSVPAGANYDLRIAHHGYKRPGHGWQTASCFGAKWRPYEIACDALPGAIKGLETYIANQEAALTEWVAKPPATITYSRGAWGDHKRTVERPADFVPPAKAEGSYTPSTYAGQHMRARYDFQSNIRYATQDLETLRKRLADWTDQGIGGAV